MIKSVMKRVFKRFGYQVNWLPKALLKNPSAHLKMSFPYVLGHHLLQSDDIFFIQVGAYDGVSNDPLADHARRLKWRGVLLEPQKEAFLALKQNYQNQPQVVLKNVAVAENSMPKTLYRIKKGASGLPDWAPQIASFSLESVLSHRSVIPNIEDLVEQIPVECVTFDSLLDEIDVKKIDVLQIDAEGFDFELIKMFPFDRVKPNVIRYEHCHLSAKDREACLEFLIARGYSIAVGDAAAGDYMDSTAYLVQ